MLGFFQLICFLFQPNIIIQKTIPSLITIFFLKKYIPYSLSVLGKSIFYLHDRTSTHTQMRAHQWNRLGVWEFAFYASRRQLRAWPGGGDGQGRSWTGIRFARLSPPTSGLARRGGGGALSWTGSLLSTPVILMSVPRDQSRVHLVTWLVKC